MDMERNNPPSLVPQIKWRLVAPWLLGLAVVSGIVFGPFGLLFYAAGLLKLSLLMFLSLPCGFGAWVTMFVVACVFFVRRLQARRMAAALLWLIVPPGIVLTFALGQTGNTPVPIGFAEGLVRRLEIRTDIEAVQAWVQSVDPDLCASNPRSGRYGPYLDRQDKPQILRHQNGKVRLELDAEGRPNVRLAWDQRKGGTWGLVIGHEEMKTPPSDPNRYGEVRREVRPGVYFWFVEG